MATFITNMVAQFSQDFKPAKCRDGRGWCIMGRDPSKYGGNYWAAIGWADARYAPDGQLMGTIAFRTKRDAKAALEAYYQQRGHDLMQAYYEH